MATTRDASDDALGETTIGAGAAGVTDGARGGTIGRFVVLEMLGQGGMGMVLAAYDPQLDRKVALKLLRPQAWGTPSASEGRARLLREARAMARLSHPNVITVHEVGEVGDEVFVAMEYAAGGTLRAWCEAAPRSWREIVARFVPAARGLAAAHAAGLVHRDFKPENVLLTADGVPRVADFGIVGITHTADGAAADGDPTLTRAGALLGTPAYMAPEQHERGEVGPPADQFAFAVSLWEALHGARPFVGDTYRQIADRAIAGEIAPPPVRSDVPAWLREVVVRGLRPDPAARWPSIDAMIEALGRDPDAARRRRIRAAAAGAGVAGLAAIAVIAVVRGGGSEVAAPPCRGLDAELAGVWDDARRAAVRAALSTSQRPDAAATIAQLTTRLDRYTAAWVDARVDACEANARGAESDTMLDLRMSCLDRRLAEADAMIDQLAGDGGPALLERSVDAVMRLSSLSSCAETAALTAPFPLPAEPDARLQWGLIGERLATASALQKLGKAADALPIAQAAAEDARALDYPPLLGEALLVRASVEDKATAEATLREALAAAATGHDDRLTAALWAELIFRVGRDSGRHAEALAMQLPAETALRRADGSAEAEARLRQVLGDVLFAAGRYDDARAQFDRALEVASAIDPEHPRVATALRRLGGVDTQQGRLDDARQRLEQVVAFWERTLGPTHHNVGVATNDLGLALQRQGDLAGARVQLERSLAVAEQTLGPVHSNLGHALNNLAIVAMKQGDHAQAFAYVARALALWEPELGPDHLNVIAAVMTQADIYLWTTQPAEALSRYERARAALERTVGLDHPYAAYAFTGIAQCQLALGRLPEALAAGERALALRESTEVAADERGQTRYAMAMILWALGKDRPRARALAERAREDFVTAGPPSATDVASVDQWLTSHR